MYGGGKFTDGHHIFVLELYNVAYTMIIFCSKKLC